MYHKSFASRITTGNLDDDLQKIAEVDWIIEVVDGLAAIHGVAGLDPVTMIDLTSSHPVEATPVGELFVRNLALCFDRRLREAKPKDGPTFSRTV